MDRYELFRRLMDMVAEDYEVNGANMYNYAGEIEISGVSGDLTINITVKLGEYPYD